VTRLVAALVVIALAAGVARADDAEAAFREASRLVVAGDYAGAQAAFEAVAAIDPQGPWADDALAEAATAAERRGDLDGARRLWRRVLAEHPDSRQSRRARARVAVLEESIGPDDRWLAVAETHEEILRDAVNQSQPTAQIEALTALAAAHPDYPRVHEVRRWIGDAWMRMGRPDRAAEVYRDDEAQTTVPEDRWAAGKALGDALALDGDLDGAERQYLSLRGRGEEMSERVLDDALADVARARTRGHLTLGAWAVLGVALLLFAGLTWRATGSPVRAARALIRPPVELLYFVPVAAVLAGVALTGNVLVWHAVRAILLGGLAVTWLSGASLEAARRARRLDVVVVIVHLIATGCAIAAICWLSVLHDRLIDMIRETWVHGHDY
jgi:tetratricopeptide (TPR) repeat protein